MNFLPWMSMQVRNWLSYKVTYICTWTKRITCCLLLMLPDVQFLTCCLLSTGTSFSDFMSNHTIRGGLYSCSRHFPLPSEVCLWASAFLSRSPSLLTCFILGFSWWHLRCAWLVLILPGKGQGVIAMCHPGLPLYFSIHLLGLGWQVSIQCTLCSC